MQTVESCVSVLHLWPTVKLKSSSITNWVCIPCWCMCLCRCVYECVCMQVCAHEHD